jgi:glycosyltransferase involved in cell wall biosynthesis
VSWLRRPRTRVISALRARLGVNAIDQRIDETNRLLADLNHARHDAQTRLAALEELTRELEVWRFMAWLRRAQPPSDRLVSVVTATRDRASYVARSIDSVLAQAHGNVELIVVDDGSTDETAAVLDKATTDPRVRTVRTEGVGVCAARNRALELVTGSVVAYLDDDNRMDPHWTLAVAWAFDQWPNTRILYGARLIDDEAAARGRAPGGLPMMQFTPFDRAGLRAGNFMDTNVLAHRSDDPEAHFDEDLSAYGDWDLALRLTESNEPRELPAIACAYSTNAPGRLSDASPGELQRNAAHIRRKLAERG